MLCSGYSAWSLCMNLNTTWSGDLDVDVKSSRTVTGSWLKCSHQDRINVNSWSKMVYSTPLGKFKAAVHCELGPYMVIVFTVEHN